MQACLFFGGAGGAHAGGGPILRLIIADAEVGVFVRLEELKVPRFSPRSPYNCFGMSSGGLELFLIQQNDRNPVLRFYKILVSYFLSKT